MFCVLKYVINSMTERKNLNIVFLPFQTKQIHYQSIFQLMEVYVSVARHQDYLTI